MFTNDSGACIQPACNIDMTPCEVGVQGEYQNYPDWVRQFYELRLSL